MSRLFALSLLILASIVVGGCSREKASPVETTPAATEGGGAATQATSGPGVGATAPAIRPAKLEPASAELPPAEPGSYVLDTASLTLYRASDLLNGVWSADGGAIAFSHCCDNDGFVDTLDVSRGTSRRIATGDVRDLAWSPDGSSLAFVPMSQYQAGMGVRVVNRDGSNVRAVVTHEGAGEPRWLDDERIAYTVGLANSDEPSFYLARLDQPGQSQLLRRKETPDDLDPRIVFGSSSNDGEWVLYFDGPYRRGEGNSLAWNRATRELRVVLPRLALSEWAANTHEALVMSIDHQTSLGKAEAVNFDTGARTQLPGGFESRWAADGRTVLYLGYQCPQGAVIGTTELFATRPGAAPRNVTAAPDELEYELAPSPVRNVVAYASMLAGPTPSWRLHLRNLDSGETVSLTLGLGPHLGDGSWSADGRYLLFTLGGGRGRCQ